MTLHVLHQLYDFYYNFTHILHIILHEDYIRSCNFQGNTFELQEMSVTPISGNGGYRLFHGISMKLPSFYTLAAKFYIQDVMSHVKKYGFTN
jgi:hypothetical protein